MPRHRQPAHHSYSWVREKDKQAVVPYRIFDKRIEIDYSVMDYSIYLSDIKGANYKTIENEIINPAIK